MNRRSTITPISTTQTIISNLKQLNIKKTTTYDGVYPSSGFRQAQQGDEVKPINGISIPPLIIGFLTTVQL